MIHADEEKAEQTPREKIARLAAMSPEEFNRFMLWNFNRICREPLRSMAGARDA